MQIGDIFYAKRDLIYSDTEKNILKGEKCVYHSDEEPGYIRLVKASELEECIIIHRYFHLEDCELWSDNIIPSVWEEFDRETKIQKVKRIAEQILSL